MTTIEAIGEVNGSQISRVRTDACNHHHTFYLEESIVNILGVHRQLGSVSYLGCTVAIRRVSNGQWMGRYPILGLEGDWKPLIERLCAELNRVEANDPTVHGVVSCECECSDATNERGE